MIKERDYFFRGSCEAEMIKRESAGGVVFRRNGNNIEVYLAKHSQYGYVLPKGGIKEEESVLEAAVREVLEETGWRVKEGFFIQKISYNFLVEKDGKEEEVQKEVSFFGFEINSEEQRENLKLEEGEKVQEGKWFNCDQAVEMLAFPSEKGVLLKLVQILMDKNGRNN